MYFGLRTYNSKHNSMGNRLNLVLNDELKAFYFDTLHVFDKGKCRDGLLINEVKRIKRDAINKGYVEVSHEVAKKW